jgi:hypothetical protein
MNFSMFPLTYQYDKDSEIGLWWGAGTAKPKESRRIIILTITVQAFQTINEPVHLQACLEPVVSTKSRHFQGFMASWASASVESAFTWQLFQLPIKSSLASRRLVIYTQTTRKINRN